MSDTYNILDWYWSVGDTLPGSQVWASARNQYVVLADATYVAWLANGNSPTIIDFQANLARVFDDYMRTVGRGSLTIVSGSSIQLTSLSYYNEVNSADGKAFMPFVFSPNGWPRTVPYYIKNTNAAVLTVYAFDQTTVLGTVANGETIFLFPTRINDTTGVGIWSFFHLPIANPADAANLTVGLVALARGGTHADLSATGGARKFLRQNTVGGDVDVTELLPITESDVPTASSVALTSVVAKDVTSLSLGAGTWDVSGTIYFTSGAGTTISWIVGTLSTTSNTVDVTQGRFIGEMVGGIHNPIDISAPIPTCRYTFGGTTTVYLVALATFAVNTLNAYGHLRAVQVG